MSVYGSWKSMDLVEQETRSMVDRSAGYRTPFARRTNRDAIVDSISSAVH